jgi:membrane protein implicated in regulation of membrane protease activity
MKSYLLAVVAVLVLDGCASMGANDGDRRFVGIVEQSQKISRAGEPSGALMALGAIGGLLHHAASGPTPTNLYRVRVSGEIFTAQSDDEYAPGTCIEIIPAKDAFLGRSYAYGQARLVASDKCAGQTISK